MINRSTLKENKVYYYYLHVTLGRSSIQLVVINVSAQHDDGEITPGDHLVVQGRLVHGIFGTAARIARIFDKVGIIVTQIDFVAALIRFVSEVGTVGDVLFTQRASGFGGATHLVKVDILDFAKVTHFVRSCGIHVSDGS